MGKISDALTKYARERRVNPRPPIRLPQLSGPDIDVLIQYDRETGHLLKYDRKNGQVDGGRIDHLRKNGTIQRLLERQLIFPTGKLTPRGVEEAKRLKSIQAIREAPPLKKLTGDHAETAGVGTTLEKSTVEGRPSQASAAARGEGGFIVACEADWKTAGTPEAKAPAAGFDHASPKKTRPGVESAVKPSGPERTIEAPAVQYAAASVGRPVQLRTVATKPEQAAIYNDAAIDPNLVALRDPHSYEAEQFKILRTHLLFPVSGTPPRSILVTSTAPGEGKTFVAANLAISIALNINKHVLLIDADLRMPQLHSRFGFGETPGLSNYLEEGRPLPSLLLKTKVDRLTLLPGGPPPDNPAELLSCDRMASLLAEVTSRYADRLIVVDAPPPSLTAETGVLARQVDGILIVVRHGKTRPADLADLISRVGDKKILGSIVNHTETSSSRYYGYNYGGYRKKQSA